jgi:hypothetical protein
MVRLMNSTRKARVQDKDAVATGTGELTSEAAAGVGSPCPRAVNVRGPYDSVAASLLCVIGQTTTRRVQPMCEKALA